MADFGSYSPEDVIAVNLRETAERTCTVWEQEMAHLRELAEQIITDSIPNAELTQTLSDHAPPRFKELFAGMRADPKFCSLLECFRSTEHSVYLCRELGASIQRQTSLSAESFFLETEEISDTARGRMIYQRNSYTDSAFLKFAKLLPAPRALYAHSFPAVCEEVYNGAAEFCILPVESSAEGQLNSFSRLIDRYGLKIAATCDIPATDNLRSTRFALLRRDLVPLSAPDRIKEHFFECPSPLLASPTPAELLCAAQLCGLSPVRIDCRSAVDDESAAKHVHYVFRAEDGDLLAFLLYLAMEAPNCEPNGFYFHID